eukprot:TRINITY_DN3196_c0_g1_i7.p1 TRINITY_DN3196_c0_g1~~TRINITY_DN3196_c0_g1_i7.p1  ORF type:complete len:417 (+),score=50.06 TRINITY_DN3196_c0_g1_i7:196-1446(+)
MSEHDIPYQNCVSTLSTLPDFTELTSAEVFLLGYCFNECKRKMSLAEIALKVLKCHNLFKDKLIDKAQKNMVEHLLFDGLYEDADAILSSFMEFVPVSRGELNGDARKDPLLLPEDLINNFASGLLRANKRQRPEENAILIDSSPNSFDHENGDAGMNRNPYNVIDPTSKKFKSGFMPPASKVNYMEEDKSEAQSCFSRDSLDKITMDYIRKLQEEDEEILKKRREQREKEETDKVQCAICMETILPEQYNPLEPCGHLLHSECAKRYLEVQIDANVFPLICPIPECRDDIDPEFIKHILDSEKFKKFDQFLLKNFIEGNADEYSCCPTPDCSYAFVWLPTEDSNVFTCPKCKGCYCLNCRCVFHTGMTCKEYAVSNNHTVIVEKSCRLTTISSCASCWARSSNSALSANTGWRRQ